MIRDFSEVLVVANRAFERLMTDWNRLECIQSYALGGYGAGRLQSGVGVLPPAAA